MRIAFGILKYLFTVFVILTFIGSIAGFILFMYFSRGLPNIITTEDYKPLTVTQILDRNQTVVGEFFEEKRYVIPIEKIPPVAVKAFVAAEDDRFFEHQGIDLHGILRAAIANFKAGKVVQGGSTITQQVAKSILLTPERSFFRKMKEIILANRMEKNLSKKQILFLYLNQIYLGNGAYGIEAAARVYFNKEAKDLTLAEAALLAGLPQAPSKYAPLTNPKRAKERQMYVLHRLSESGVIKPNEMVEAVKLKIAIYQPQDISDKFAPYYVEHVRKYLLDKYGKEALYKGGLTVQTPLDVKLSMLATQIVQENLRVVDKRQGYRGPVKKYQTQQELKNAESEVLSYNISKKFPYEVLLPEGTLAKNSKDRLISVKNEIDALDENEIYKALVLDVSNAKRDVIVNLGLTKAVLPFEQITKFTEISRPSQVFNKGDLIWVRLISKVSKIGLPMVALEQIPVIQGALLSMDVNTGAVIAMVGGYDFNESEFNRAIQAERQPGSAYKPIIYAAAIDKGYTPVTIIQDSPVVFNAGENEKWKPENFEERFYGDTTMRLALIHSRNIPTIKIVHDIQVPYLIEYSKRLGITEHLNPDLSIALGSSSISLLELLRVYAIFPRGGRRVQPVFINRVISRNGKVLEEHLTAPAPPSPVASTTPSIALTSELPPQPLKPVLVAGELLAEINAGKDDSTRGEWKPDPKDPDRVMDPRTAYVMTHMMNEVATIGTGAQAKDLGRPAAGKTGTTSDYIDAWFLGFTTQVITGAWVGYDNQKSIGPKSTGAKIALPIWLSYMKEAVKTYPSEDFAVPKGVTFALIDSKTGKLVGANRPSAVREAFVEGTEPGAVSTKPNEPQTQAAVTTTQQQQQPEGVKNTPQPVPDEVPPTEEFYKKDIE